MFLSQKSISLKCHILTSAPLCDREHISPYCELKITKNMFAKFRQFQTLRYLISIFFFIFYMFCIFYIFCIYCWRPHSLTSFGFWLLRTSTFSPTFCTLWCFDSFRICIFYIMGLSVLIAPAWGPFGSLACRQCSCRQCSCRQCSCRQYSCLDRPIGRRGGTGPPQIC